MRKLFIFAFLANVALTAVSYVLLPARVALHFGWGGIPNSWGPKELNALLSLAVVLLVFFLSFALPPLVLKLPPGMINLPNKDYWLKPENLPQARERFKVFMREFGIAFFAFLFLVGLLVLDANFKDPVRLNEGLLFSGLIVLILYSVYWCVRFFRSFRLPPDTQTRKSYR